MQHILLTFFFLFFLAPAFGQLADHYQFEQEGRTLSLAEKMAVEQAPGFSTYLLYGEGRDSLALGMLARGSRRPVESTTPFPVGAMSEAPVLFEFLRLSDEGKISLDDPVAKYLPGLSDRRWFRARPVTIRDLILRRKSLNGPMKPSGYGPGEGWPALQDVVADGNADFPGGLAVRSNRKRQQPQCANAILLQLILEKYYRQPLPQIMAERVLGPLGMRHSFYAVELSDSQVEAAALGHDKSGATLPGGYRRYPELAAMGLWTTPADYARFVHHVIQAAKGKDNRFLKPATARAGLTAQSSYRSLLFHVNKDGLIYWGGNAKGYFTAMQASLADDYIMAAFCNGNLNWPLVMGSLYQSGGWIAQQRKGEKLVLFTRPGDEALSTGLREQLRAYARKNQVHLMELDANRGAPPSVTATPALLFQSPAGRALYGGKPTDWAAVENFIRTARSRPVAPEAATPGPILALRDGRQAIGFPLKWTEWKGPAPAAGWQEAFLPILAERLGAGYRADAGFFPTDRRFYLDLHPYAQGDSVFLSLAVFSQFDCIHPIFDNFGRPLGGKISEKEALLRQAAALFADVVEQRWADAAAGDRLFALPEEAPVKGYEVLGLAITPGEEGASRQASAPYTPPLSGSWKQPEALAAGQPLLQFNFPSPLERYAGEVRRLTGALSYEPGKLSGKFVAELKSLTMGMAELDAKVLRQYLKVRKYATATFSFSEAAAGLAWDQDNEVQVAGTFHFLGQDIPLTVDATLRPRSADGAMEARIQFELDIARPFGLPGPDGPAAARERLQFSLQFQMAG
ncbi:MAG: serine hydrolase [Phaeodactylibacter sp.]|nr:serine hydrolase [Phaeodactylibacter sp.]